MNKKIWHGIAVTLLISVYVLIYYLAITDQYKLDFSSFYSAFLALIQGENPYQALFANYLPEVRQVSNNLNPPIMLWLFSPIFHLNYFSAVAVWFFLLFFMGLIGAGLTFYHAFSAEFLRKHVLSLFLIYLAFFPTLMNLAIAQVGCMIFFFLMVGYHFYLNKKDILAGLFWGTIIAIKFFPALLFFYVLKQGRFKVFMIMLITFLICMLIPYIVYGGELYKQYYWLVSRPLWYADSWNASVYGYLFRLLSHSFKHPQNLGLIHALYVGIFFVTLLGYLIALSPKSEKNPLTKRFYQNLIALNKTSSSLINHQPFCLTLVLMLLLSPFAWMYYFSVLLFPLVLLWSVTINEKDVLTQTALLWLLSFFLINFPIDYVVLKHMESFIGRITYFSFHFYGLLLLTGLVWKEKTLYAKNARVYSHVALNLMTPIFIILALGFFVPLTGFLSWILVK